MNLLIQMTGISPAEKAIKQNEISKALVNTFHIDQRTDCSEENSDSYEMPRKPSFLECQLCQRETELTFHHLIPKKMHRRPRFKRQYTREQLNSGIWICYACHKGLHRLYTELQLATDLNSLDKLFKDQAVTRHVEWVAKQR